MPYITQERREAMYDQRSFASPGELNYVIIENINDYIEDFGVSYTTYNAIIGVLECAKLELYRRLVAKYEDKKIKENGDVFYES